MGAMAALRGGGFRERLVGRRRAERTDHAKDGGKDVVDEDVGEARDGGRAAADEGGGGGAGAGVVGDEGGRRAVEVAAAVELRRSRHQHTQRFTP